MSRRKEEKTIFEEVITCKFSEFKTQWPSHLKCTLNSEQGFFFNVRSHQFTL